MEALLWQIEGIASCTHHTPEQLRLPLHTAKCSQSTVEKFFILRAGITPVNVRICRWVLGIWHWHACITPHASKSCKAWLRSKNRYVEVHTKYILLWSWYILVHTQNSYASGYARGSDTYLVHTWYATVLHQYVPLRTML